MPMICIKTGCQLYEASHGRWYRGDLYSTIPHDQSQAGAVWCMKYTYSAYEPLNTRHHATCVNADLAVEGMIVTTSPTFFSYEGI